MFSFRFVRINFCRILCLFCVNHHRRRRLRCPSSSVVVVGGVQCAQYYICTYIKIRTYYVYRYRHTQTLTHTHTHVGINTGALRQLSRAGSSAFILKPVRVFVYSARTSHNCCAKGIWTFNHQYMHTSAVRLSCRRACMLHRARERDSLGFFFLGCTVPYQQNARCPCTHILCWFAALLSKHKNHSTTCHIHKRFDLAYTCIEHCCSLRTSTENCTKHVANMLFFAKQKNRPVERKNTSTRREQSADRRDTTKMCCSTLAAAAAAAYAHTYIMHRLVFLNSARSHHTLSQRRQITHTHKHADTSAYIT